MEQSDIINLRQKVKDKKRIVVKIGSSSLQHPETGDLDYNKMEVLVRELCNIRNSGKDIVLVTSGAISVGKKAVHIKDGSEHIALKQACAAIGQARLMMNYQKFFSEYNQVAAQVLMTKDTITNPVNRMNAHNTFTELLSLGVIPVVNENDTISTFEIKFGDNDTLSSIVAFLINADLLILMGVIPIVNENDTVATDELDFGDNDTLSALVLSLIEGDLLILLSDIDGLYSDNPRKNPNAKFIEVVEELNEEIWDMGKKETGSSVGTGGMNTKLNAAEIASRSGCDMIIANSADIHILHRIIDGRNFGTFFISHKDTGFYLPDYVALMNED